MNVEIGAEAALFPEKEYMNGIAVAVRVYSGYQHGRFLLTGWTYSMSHVIGRQIQMLNWSGRVMYFHTGM
jgi:hypothetical protein